MANRLDLGLINNDILIQNNDVTIVESDDQHIVDCINALPGWWKENPTAGVGITSYLKSRNAGQVLSRITKLQLTADGYTCRPTTSVDSKGELILNPNVSI
jgi:hypothetical protein